MDYAKTILFNRQDLLRALRRRLSERLKPYADALNLLFADLFRGRLPVDWRERWRTFVAEQAALGYVTEPWSVRDMERFIFEWARFCELLPVEEMRMAYAPADQPRAAMQQAGNEKDATQPQRDPGESEFDRQLAEAAGAVEEISTILESLALKIDYAPINAPKEVHAEVDRIDALIRGYNEAIERAREVWLRERLSSAEYQRLLTLKGPLHLGLPAFTDAQRQRAVEQQRRIFARLGQGSQTLPETPPLSPEEAAECLVCKTLGGGVEIAAYQREGKWRVCKLLSLSSGQLTPEDRRIFQMPAPTSNHGVKLATVVVSFILVRKGIANAEKITQRKRDGGDVHGIKEAFRQSDEKAREESAISPSEAEPKGAPPVPIQLASQTVSRPDPNFTVENVKTAWILGTGTANPDTLNGMINSVNGLLVVVKIGDLVNLVKLLSEEAPEQILGLLEHTAGEVFPDGEDAMEKIEALQKIVRSSRGYSWWLRVEWDLVDKRTGAAVHKSTTEFFDGGPHGGAFGGKFGGSADDTVLEAFKQRKLNELRLTHTIVHKKQFPIFKR